MIKFKNISLSFNNKDVLKNLSLSINEGEKILIRGKSGTGKTSLLKMLLGFSKPKSGEIFFNEMLLDSKSIWKIRKKIAYIDQDVNSIGETVYDWFNFVKNIKTNRKINFDSSSILNYFDFFHLDKSLLNSSILALSGGEKQRISIVTALLLKRKIFLLDEITASLDTELKRKTVDLFLSNPEFTILTISHDSFWETHPNIKIFDIEEGLII